MKLYTLFDSIASGGMGTVYYGRANAPSGVSRVVAVKRMHGELARDPVCLEMFRDELRLATRVRHPNVVATLDVVEQEGDLLMVMEFVQGESLQELIARCQQRSEPVPPAIAVSIACGILQGLEAVHDAKSETGEPLGIVHRDVSPENILVGRDGIARLLDFGIARGAGRKHVTRVGEIKGKPSYLAPEQILEGGQRVDRRADVYGVAVVLWEALTGRRLFDGDSPTVALSKVLTDPVPAPSSLVASLPQGLDDVVMRGLSRNPDERYSTALEMARALRCVCGTFLPFEVAEWLEQMTPESLARQATRVAELERSPLATPEPRRGVKAARLADAEEDAPESTRTNMALTPRRAPVRPSALERSGAWLQARPTARRLGLTALVAAVGFSTGLLLVSAAFRSSAPSAPELGVALPVAAAQPLSSAQPTARAKLPVAPAAVPAAAVVAAPSASADAPRKRKRAAMPAAPSVRRPAVVDDGF
jgi:eukaryotic-like serine/threonine-protein kinase